MNYAFICTAAASIIILAELNLQKGSFFGIRFI